MSVLLINPSRTYHQHSQELRLGLPLGLLSIASVLHNESISVSILDCLISSKTEINKSESGIFHGIDDKVIISAIQKETPEIIGITCPFSSQLDNCLNIAKLIKKINSDIVVVVGGPHFSVASENEIIEYSDIDFFISGEGELSMLELVQAIKNKQSYKNIAGVSYRTNGIDSLPSIHRTPSSLINNLDSLPLPAYHLMEMNTYFCYQSQGLHARRGPEGRTISMITSRGCPFNCIFCSAHLHMGKKVRAHSAAYVVSHVEQVINDYSIDHIFFEDDNLTFYPERTNNIFDSLYQKRINFTWSTPNGVRADTLDKELLKTMKKSGCIELIVGTESGDQETLDKIIKKQLKLENVIQVAKWCKELEINLKSFFIIGFPGETKEKIQNTIDFAVMLFDKYNVIPLIMFATPLIGTQLYDIVIKGKYNVRDISSFSLSSATSSKGKGLISTSEFTPEDLEEFILQLQSRLDRYW